MKQVPSQTLWTIPVGEIVSIATIDLDREATAWVRAVGLTEGVQVKVLRRAVFGGPIHVRIVCGGEFAVGRELAHQIRVEPAPSAEPR